LLCCATYISEHESAVNAKHSCRLSQGNLPIWPVVKRAGGDDHIKTSRWEWKVAYVALNQKRFRTEPPLCFREHFRR
jgi:hypothetical protein